MGTRGTVHFIEDKKIVCSIYRQMDSYPTGLGNELFEILKKSTVVNGYGLDMKCPANFNGMGCLAAYVIGKLKGEDIGSVYISNKTDRQDYNYFISLTDNGHVWLKLTSFESKKALFNDYIGNFGVIAQKLSEAQ